MGQEIIYIYIYFKFIYMIFVIIFINLALALYPLSRRVQKSGSDFVVVFSFAYQADMTQQWLDENDNPCGTFSRLLQELLTVSSLMALVES